MATQENYDNDRNVEVIDRDVNYMNRMELNQKDRVRWGPILAGIFSALTTLLLLAVLGVAIGLASYQVGEPLGSFGIGAGIWGAISTLIAFLVGGWVAARSSGVFGRGNGILNGAMVWVVTIPLLLFTLGSGVNSLVGNLVGAASNVAGTAAEVAGPAVSEAAGALLPSNLTVEGAQATAEAAGNELTAADAQATVDALATQAAEQVQAAAPDAETVNEATGSASTAAFSTLLALLLGLGASVLGGAAGARDEDDVDTVRG